MSKPGSSSSRQRAANKTLSYSHRIDAIQKQREQQMAEIRLLARLRPAVTGSFVQKAETLLTVGWGRASWQARANILRTVTWLLDMERMHPVT